MSPYLAESCVIKRQYSVPLRPRQVLKIQLWGARSNNSTVEYVRHEYIRDFFYTSYYETYRRVLSFTTWSCLIHDIPSSKIICEPNAYYCCFLIAIIICPHCINAKNDFTKHKRFNGNNPMRRHRNFYLNLHFHSDSTINLSTFMVKWRYSAQSFQIWFILKRGNQEDFTT